MKRNLFKPEDPKYLNMREVYLQSLDEMAIPFPSITLQQWPDWNVMTGGFRMREFTILCGGTGTGKTQFLAQISAQLLKQNVKHFVMSVETGYTDFMKRILSVLAGRDLNTGDAVRIETLSKLHVDNSKYLEADTIEFSLYEDRVKIEQLIHDIRYMQAKGCKVAFIDNLNFFLEVTKSVDQIVEMDRVIHDLIIMCKQIEMHVIMICHPRKTESGRVLSEYDIKGSSTAVQEAHNVFLFNRPKAEDVKSGEADKTDRDLTVAKMRRRGKYVGHSLRFSFENSVYSVKGWS